MRGVQLKLLNLMFSITIKSLLAIKRLNIVVHLADSNSLTPHFMFSNNCCEIVYFVLLTVIYIIIACWLFPKSSCVFINTRLRLCHSDQTLIWCNFVALSYTVPYYHVSVVIIMYISYSHKKYCSWTFLFSDCETKHILLVNLPGNCLMVSN